MTALIATGAPKPASASSSAPKQKAMTSAWMRGSSESRPKDRRRMQVLGANGHPVHPQGVDDDPQDGEETEDGALGGAGERLPQRHAVGEPGDENGGEEAGQAGQVRLHADAAEQDQDEHEGQGRH
jgi:hypothetical protein